VKRFRSVRGQLLSALVVVVLVALATSYLLVTPSLNQRLVSGRQDELEGAARSVAVQIPRAGFNVQAWQQIVETLSTSANARLVVLQQYPSSLEDLADSAGTTGSITSDPVARLAVNTNRIERGTATRGGVRYAEVALPKNVYGARVVILASASVRNAERDLDWVSGALLVAAIPALLVALALGALGSRRLIGRIRRLEQAADLIAGGSFGEPIVDSHADEVGQLARSFDRMRIRLEQLEKARREFIANASHELRTPLFALAGSLELLADEEMDDSKRREFIETMRGQVARLTRLAIALLDLSRIDAGKLELNVQPLPLRVAAEALQKEFAPVARLSGHALSLELEDGPIVVADEERVLQIGRVLIENAIVHTPAGTRVTVRILEEAGYGLLSVADDGPGIPAAEQARVFDRFYRAGGERTSGSGLGLAIAREWAKRMSGDIRLESRPGATSFTLALSTTGSEE
jgi:signal transduction histidine kinase